MIGTLPKDYRRFLADFCRGLGLGMFVWIVMWAAVNGAMFDLYPMAWVLPVILILPAVGLWAWLVDRAGRREH